MNSEITVEVLIDAPIEKIWEYWTEPEHITHWAFASSDWQAPMARNELTVGGKFKTRMEVIDGKEGFDFDGTYTKIERHKRIEYTMDDGRKVRVSFVKQVDGYKVIENFDPESTNSIAVQRAGWQTIIDNFKKYVESHI